MQSELIDLIIAIKNVSFEKKLQQEGVYSCGNKIPVYKCINSSDILSKCLTTQGLSQW